MISSLKCVNRDPEVFKGVLGIEGLKTSQLCVGTNVCCDGEEGKK